MKKLIPSQTRKYDIDQKIMHELTNLESRLVLFSIIKQARTSVDICSITTIPLSTTYVKLHNLEELSLIYVEKNILEDGRKTKYYRSKIKGIDISISKQRLRLFLLKNKI